MSGIKEIVNKAILDWVSEIKRAEMPQVRGKEIPEIRKIFDDYGIEYHGGVVECGKLRPTQEDYKPEKVENMIKSIKSGDWKESPIFISNDGYILDGHHRWLARKEISGDDYKLPVIMVDLPLEKALYVFSVGADKVNEGKMYNFNQKELKNKKANDFNSGDVIRVGKYDIELKKEKYKDTFALESRVLNNSNWKYIHPTFWPWYINMFLSDQKYRKNETIDPCLQKFANSLGAEIIDDNMNVRLQDITEINGNKIIVVYPGRFQPFHQNHYDAYQLLVKKFGKDSVYIATSNNVEPENSPFNFAEKRLIMTKMFGISKNKIIQVVNPYLNMSYKSLGDPYKDVLVVGIGEKDAGRLTSAGKFYEKYKSGDKQPFSEKGYVYTISLRTMKIGGQLLTGSLIRKIFKQGSDKAKQQLFKKLYGKFDQNIYNLIIGKLNESVILSTEVIEEYLIHNNLKKIISELSNAIDAQVDDGPATFYKAPQAYKKGKLNTKQKSMEELIEEIGWQVVNWLAGDKEDYAGYKFRSNLVGDVSFGDVGIRDTNYPNPLKQYQNYMKSIAESIGYSVIDWLLGDNKEKNIIDDPKKEMAKYEPLRQDTSNASEPLSEEIILEGGAYGHVNHVFDDWELTFGDLRNLIEVGLEGKLEMVQEKCLDGNSKVNLQNNGEKTIKEVVDNKIRDKILSYNEENDKIEYKEIIGYADNGITEEWLEIELEDGNILRLTPNHRIFVKNVGYVKTKDLTDDMELIII